MPLVSFSRLSRLACLVAFCAVVQILSSGTAQAAWWNADWKYRIKIDANTGPKGANITEPIGRTQVLVRLLANNFKFDTAKQDGGDLRFVGADDRTPLHYHIEKFDGLVDEVALVWVDVPDLAPGVASNFYMYWGNDKANDASDAHATYDSDQVLVWHFAEENGLPKDSTSFNNNALTPGKRDQNAIIGFGSVFDGTSPIKLAPNPTLNVTAGQTLTWQVWLKPKTQGESAVIYDLADAAGVNDFRVGLEAGVPFASATSAAGTLKAAAPAALVGDSWHMLSVTADASKMTLFVDGAKVAEAAGPLAAITGAAVLGGAAAATPPTSGTPAGFVGEMDELEISKVVRPNGAIALADHDQGTQANLLVFENPEQTSSFGSGYIGIILKSVTADAWVVIGILIFMMLVSWLVMLSKALYVGKVAGSNKKFLVLLKEMRKGAGLLPSVPRERVRALRGSCLYRVYETGVREVNERLEGGRTLPDGSIAPQSLAAIRSSMDAQMVREIEKLNNLMVFLTIAISGGPFVGLLGTVIGVMITFAAIAAAGDVNVNSIAPGISAALLATATGMFVAIPALFGYNYFQVRIKGVISEMQVFVDEVITRIAEGEFARGKPMPGE